MTGGGPLAEAWVQRRSARARRLSVRVFFDGRVEVVVPLGVGESTVRGFVDRHREWVERRLAKIGLERPLIASGPPSEIDLSAIGERWVIRHEGGSGRPRLQIVDRGVLGLHAAADPAEAGRLLRHWLRHHAQRVVGPRLAERADAGGYRYAALRWRRQRTRWGSCSSRGVISLNLCVLFQAPEVLDYLMCHELVHTRHPNHSPAYWAEVARVCPDWWVHDRALRTGWRRVPAWMFA